MNCEESRLVTFRKWPASAEVEPRRIAKAGFFYTGRDLEVECFICKGKISHWNYGDQVMVKHREINPRCPFVKNPGTSGNIPIVIRNSNVLNQGSEFSQMSKSSSSLPSFTSTSNVGCSSSKPSGVIPNNSRQISNEENNCSRQEHSKISVCNSIHPLSHITLADYKNEAVRLQSFMTWPKSHVVSPSLLAKNGFYYLQDDDWVQCVVCQGKIHGWEPGDDPQTEHLRHFPSCLHYNAVASNSSNNVDNKDHFESTSKFKVVEESQPFSLPEGGKFATEQRDIENHGIISHRGPKHPRYSTIESRLRSFRDWSQSIIQTPQQLAQAGFYYTGVEDRVRCFHCDGGLRQWDELDDPWIEHARWFSKCTYVLLVKGKEFVQCAVAQHPPLLPAAEVQKNVNDSSRSNRSECGVHELSGETRNGLMDSPVVKEKDASFQKDAFHVLRHQQRTKDALQAESSLQEENVRLKEARLCKICMDEEVGVVFVPCGHLATCINCAASVECCPMCRQPIKATVRTFLS